MLYTMFGSTCVYALASFFIFAVSAETSSMVVREECDFTNVWEPTLRGTKISKTFYRSRTSTPVNARVTVLDRSTFPLNFSIRYRIMKDGKRVRIIDLYKVIKEQCGGNAKKCGMFQDQPNVVSHENGRSRKIGRSYGITFNLISD